MEGIPAEFGVATDSSQDGPGSRRLVPLLPNPSSPNLSPDRLINISHQVFMNSPGYRPNKRSGRVAATQAWRS